MFFGNTKEPPRPVTEKLLGNHCALMYRLVRAGKTIGYMLKKGAVIPLAAGRNAIFQLDSTGM